LKFSNKGSARNHLIFFQAKTLLTHRRYTLQALIKRCGIFATRHVSTSRSPKANCLCVRYRRITLLWTNQNVRIPWYVKTNRTCQRSSNTRNLCLEATAFESRTLHWQTRRLYKPQQSLSKSTYYNKSQPHSTWSAKRIVKYLTEAIRCVLTDLYNVLYTVSTQQYTVIPRLTKIIRSGITFVSRYIR